MLSTAISDGAAVIESVSEAERSSLDLDAQSRMVAVYGMKGQVRFCGVRRELKSFKCNDASPLPFVVLGS